MLMLHALLVTVDHFFKRLFEHGVQRDGEHRALRIGDHGSESTNTDLER